MRNRSVALAGTVAVALALLALAAPATAAPDPDVPRLTLSAERIAESAPVAVTGSCPLEGDPVEPTGVQYPQTTDVFVDGRRITDGVTLTDGEFTEPVELPEDMSPGQHRITTTCGGTATVTVVVTPSLQVEPNKANIGDEITASGRCPPFPQSASLSFDDREVSAFRVPLRGTFQPQTFTVPDGAAAGDHLVTTSCGGRAELAVLPAQRSPTPTPSSSTAAPTIGPSGTVTVPDLTGLSEADAVTRLGSSLVLGERSGSGDRIVGQDPPPATQVPPGTAVSVVLAAVQTPVSQEAGSGGPSLVIVIAAVLVVVLLLLLAVASPQARRWRRRRRNQRTLRRIHARTRVVGASVSGVPHGDVPGVSIDLYVSRDPPRLEFSEVHRAPH
jgi:hypothetical protein